MRSTHPSATRHWDGSPIASRPRRPLQIAPDGASRLLRCGQGDRCRECGNRIEWYRRGTGTQRQPVRLHSDELPITQVPAACHWHVSSGVAYPAGDGSNWCRLPHAVICPARDASITPAQLAGLRRVLAVTTRRLIDTGGFTPAPDRPVPAGAGVRACRPAHPVVQLLYLRYLAAHPLDEIRCVAQTRRRHRCTNTVLTPGTPTGVWRLVPAATAEAQLALPSEAMAVYSLNGLPHAEQLRWRAQRCPQHAAAPAAADLAIADWTPFDLLRHHEHIHTRLPDRGRPPGPAGRARGAACP
jgi:hypothetical protein